MLYLSTIFVFSLFSSAFSKYDLTEKRDTEYGFDGTLQLTSEDVQSYGLSLQKLALSVYLDKDEYLRVKITDADNSRYEIPESVIQRPKIGPALVDRKYGIEVTESPFAFKVMRNEDKQCIFSFASNFTFKDQFIQFSSLIDSSATTFGLGESTRLQQHLTSGTTYTLWARDEPAAVRDTNLYGSYPVYWQMLNGQAHGAMLFNSNGMDIDLEDNTIRYTVIGGVVDLYVFVGPTPTDVSKQYTSVVGRPALMPYWSLGFHNCKWG
jgi:alpha-glucosidase